MTGMKNSRHVLLKTQPSPPRC